MISERDPNRNEFGIEIFADEITKQKSKITNENWLYVGALFIPVSTKNILLKQLNDCRCLNENNKKWATPQSECPINCKYHVQNDTEIHYVKDRKSVV